MPKIRRKTIAAREDLIERGSEVAKQKGYSFYAYVNEILELALQADDLGVSLRGLIDEREVLKAAKEASYVLGLESIWYELSNIAFEKAKRKAITCWSEAGAWLAKRYISSGIADPFLSFKRDLETFTWNATELDVERKQDKVSIRIISPRFSESYTILFASFLENALKTFNFTRFTKEVSRGTIRMKAYRRKS